MNKQDEVSRYLKTVPQATIEEIYCNVTFVYYCNEKKHLGTLLSRMVKSGKIERVRKGVYRHVTLEEYAEKCKQLRLIKQKHFEQSQDEQKQAGLFNLGL